MFIILKSCFSKFTFKLKKLHLEPPGLKKVDSLAYTVILSHPIEVWMKFSQSMSVGQMKHLGCSFC